MSSSKRVTTLKIFADPKQFNFFFFSLHRCGYRCNREQLWPHSSYSLNSKILCTDMIIQLNVNYVFSSTLVRSWFTPTPCIVCIPSLWSAAGRPSSSLWPAVYLESRPRDHSTRWACPQRRRPSVSLLFGLKFTSQDRGQCQNSQANPGFTSPKWIQIECAEKQNRHQRATPPPLIPLIPAVPAWLSGPRSPTWIYMWCPTAALGELRWLWAIVLSLRQRTSQYPSLLFSKGQWQSPRFL